MARRAKGTGSIYKDSQGYWNAQLPIGISSDGKTQYKKFRSKKQDTVIKKMTEYQFKTGAIDKQTINKTSLEDYLKNYLENVKKGSIKPSSYDRNYDTYQSNIKPRIGYYSITNITSEIIQNELISRMISEKYSYSSIRKAYILLNECFKYALKKEQITKNPCDIVKLPLKENIQEKEIRFLSDEEIDIFKKQANMLKATKNEPRYKYGNILCLIIYTGLRIGELCALKWEDINFKDKYVKVGKNIMPVYEYSGSERTRTVIEQQSTKTKKHRTVHLNLKAIDILKKQKELVGGDSKAYIINGTHEITDKTVPARSYTDIAKAARIPCPSGVHALRHTFASLMIRKGIDIKIISDILGHSSVAFTYNTYVHLIDEQKARAVSMLDDI